MIGIGTVRSRTIRKRVLVGWNVMGWYIRREGGWVEGQSAEEFAGTLGGALGVEVGDCKWRV